MIERALRLMAAEGKLGHLTLVRTSKGWQAAHRPPEEAGYKVAKHADPIEAILESLSPGFKKDWRDTLDNWADSW